MAELPGGAEASAEPNRLLPARVPEVRVIERPATMPLSAPAMAAAGGFLAGFTTLVLARIVRRGGRLLPRARRRRALDIAGSRSFLVDIHFLKR